MQTWKPACLRSTERSHNAEILGLSMYVDRCFSDWIADLENAIDPQALLQQLLQ